VAPDLGLVSDAADRDAHELAPERAGNRLPERGLADSWRPDEAEDRPREILLELRDGEMLDDPLLHLLEVVVVLVEDLARLVEVEVVLGRFPPGNGDDPFQIGADDAVLGGGGRQLRQAVELATRLLLDFLGEVGLFDLRPQLGHLGLLLVAFAELVLDGLQLLAEEVLPLGVLHLRLHLGLDLRAELEHLELAVEDHSQLAQARLDVGNLEELLLLLGLEPHRGRDEIGERAGVLGIRRRELQLVRQIGDEGDDPRKEGLDVAGERVDLLPGSHDVRQVLELADEVRIVLEDAGQLHAVEALDEDPERPVGDTNHLVDDGGGSDRIEILRRVRVLLAPARGDERDGAIVRDGLVDQSHRALLADGEGRHGVREDDGLLERENRQDVLRQILVRVLTLFGARLFDGAHETSLAVI
jgi:hypothetical protein